MNQKLFQKLSYGLYVIGSVKSGSINGQVANTVFQISSDPATVAVSINKNNLTNEFIKASNVFSVSILLNSASMDLIRLFGFKSGREINKFQTVSFKQGLTGVPFLLEQTAGYLEAEVINSIDVETHTVFIGKVIDADILSNEEPMTYSYYHKIKRGVSQAKEISIKEEKKDYNKLDEKEENKMNKYQCSICGYIYDPAQGDPDSGIAPGTPFEEIPDSWVCPVCGVTKDQFEPVK